MSKLTVDDLPNLPNNMKYITCSCGECIRHRVKVGERFIRKQLLYFIECIQTAQLEVNNG